MPAPLAVGATLCRGRAGSLPGAKRLLLLRQAARHSRIHSPGLLLLLPCPQHPAAASPGPAALSCAHAHHCRAEGLLVLARRLARRLLVRLQASQGSSGTGIAAGGRSLGCRRRRAHQPKRRNCCARHPAAAVPPRTFCCSDSSSFSCCSFWIAASTSACAAWPAGQQEQQVFACLAAPKAGGRVAPCAASPATCCALPSFRLALSARTLSPCCCTAACAAVIAVSSSAVIAVRFEEGRRVRLSWGLGSACDAPPQQQGRPSGTSTQGHAAASAAFIVISSTKIEGRTQQQGRHAQKRPGELNAGSVRLE